MELLETRCVLSGDVILQWNAVALAGLKGDYALGHTPDQGGPTRDSRALAIVHAAMFDAVNSIDGRYTPYLTVAPNAKGASIDAAAAQAAHDTLVQLYPSQKATFDAALTDTLAHVPNGKAEDGGVAVGKYVAAAILAARAGDGSDAMMDYHPIGKPGHHQPDPLHPEQGFLTPDWGNVTPFAIPNVAQYVSPPPPALTARSTRRRSRRSRRWAATASRRRRCAPPSRPKSASSGATTAAQAWARRRGCTTRSPASLPSSNTIMSSTMPACSPW